MSGTYFAQKQKQKQKQNKKKWKTERKKKLRSCKMLCLSHIPRWNCKVFHSSWIPLEPCAAFHLGRSHSIRLPNRMAGFYITCNTRQKCVKCSIWETESALPVLSKSLKHNVMKAYIILKRHMALWERYLTDPRGTYKLFQGTAKCHKNVWTAVHKTKI